MEIQVQFTIATARQVKKCLSIAMKEECNGCQIQHGSQLQHQCVMLEDEEERVRFCLDKALEIVEWKFVKFEMFGHMRPSLVLRLPGCYDDEKWLRDVWRNEPEREMLVNILTRMLMKED